MESLGTKTIIKDQSLLRHEDIRRNIRVLPDLQSFIPSLLPDELKQLENNIRKDGCREALLIWETTEGTLAGSEDTTPVYVLVDGHNRYGICQRNGIDFRVNLVSFPGLSEVRSFMIDNQLGRRNLTPEQTAYLRGLRYLDERGERGKYKRDDHKGQNVPYEIDLSAEGSEIDSKRTKSPERVSAAQKLAKHYSVNEKTIKRDAEFAAGVDKLAPALKADVLAGKTPVNKTTLQQLAKSTVADGSISSLETLIPSSPAGADQALSTDKAGKSSANQLIGKAPKPAWLRKKLQSLVNQLTTSPGNESALCDDIITCATQLKLAGFENHQGERKENH